MPDPAGVLDRGVPDVVDTGVLPPRLAAEIDYLAGRTAPWTEPAPTSTTGIRARALVVAGRAGEARDALAGLASAEPADDQDAFAAIWAASRVGGPAPAFSPGASDLDDQGFVVVDDVPIGHPTFALGLAALHRGDLEAAAELLGQAVVAGDRRSPLWGALARIELARVRWTLADLLPADDPSRVGVIDEARRLALSARMFFVAGGYRHLTTTTGGLFGHVDGHVDGDDGRTAPDRAEPRLGHLVEGTTWTVGFGAEPPVEVRPTKGLVALRHLVRTPGQAIAAVELDLVVDGEDPEDLGHDALLTAVASGEVDATVLRPRLLDPRARSRTSKLLRRTIDRLADDHRALARHLSVTVRTGYACRYDGDPAITWRR